MKLCYDDEIDVCTLKEGERIDDVIGEILSSLMYCDDEERLSENYEEDNYDYVEFIEHKIEDDEALEDIPKESLQLFDECASVGIGEE